MRTWLVTARRVEHAGEPITGPVPGAVWQWAVEAPTYDEAIDRIKESGFFCGEHKKRFTFYAWSDSLLVGGGFTEVFEQPKEGEPLALGDSGGEAVQVSAGDAA